MVGCERLTQHNAGPVASDEVQGVYFCITYRQTHQQRANTQAKHLLALLYEYNTPCTSHVLRVAPRMPARHACAKCRISVCTYVYVHMRKIQDC